MMGSVVASLAGEKSGPSPRGRCQWAGFWLVCAMGAVLAACSSETDDPSGEGLIDDPCRSADDCAAASAVCIEVGDGVRRCEVRCSTNHDCPAESDCLVESGESTGYCYRSCRTANDCAAGDWECADIASNSSHGSSVNAAKRI